MKTSPVYPRYEMGDNYDHHFDPQFDFAQFLKEARNNEYKKGNVEVALSSPENTEGVKQSSGGPKKNKKSWKSSLFSWLKAEKRENKPPNVEPSEMSCYVPKPNRKVYSGPIHGAPIVSRRQRPNSGPLTGLFNSTKKRAEKEQTPTKKRAEKEQTPYVCLDKLNNNFHTFESYGPVYLVT